MAGLQDQVFEGSTWVPSITRYSNLLGTPLLSAVPNFSGEALADVYTLTFTDVDTLVKTAKVYVLTAAPNNPYKRVVGLTVNIDGTTIYKNVVPSVNLVFRDIGTFANTWSAEVRVGTFEGTFNAYGDDAGTPGSGQKHRVLNTDAGAAADCKVTLRTMAILIVKTGIVFDLVKPFAVAATEKQAGGGSQRVMPHAITVDNISGSGAGKTFDLLVDGSPVNVTNLSTGVNGPSTALNVIHNYKVTTGGLNSVEFKLSQSCITGSSANLMIFSSRFVQVAPDVDGVEGEYGTDDVILTQTGETAGIIQPSGVAYYWVRALVPEGANSESNPYPSNIFIVGKQTGTAGWTA